MEIIKDINSWGPLCQIIVENIPFFQDQFFELFSAQVLIQDYTMIVPWCDIRISVFVNSCGKT